MDSLFLDPAKEILVKVISFVWLSMVALVIIVIGWLLSKGIRSIVSRILKALKVDRLSEKAGIAKFLAKGGVSGNLSDLIAVIVYWLFMLVVVMVTRYQMTLRQELSLAKYVQNYITVQSLSSLWLLAFQTIPVQCICKVKLTYTFLHTT